MFKSLATKQAVVKSENTENATRNAEKCINVWIDYYQAHILAFDLASKSWVVTDLLSKLPAKHKARGGTRGENGMVLGAAAAKSEEGWREEHLKKYLEEILLHIADADRLVIMGPGTAKHDLKRHLKNHKALFAKLEQVMTAKKLTARQLMAETREIFGMVKELAIAESALG